MNLSPAPRPLPLTLSIRIMLGGLMSQMGWGLMTFGLIFVWVFDAGGAISSALRFSGELAAAEGMSTGWQQTNLTINDTPVYETSFTFRSADGYDLSGASFASGGYVDEGELVTVEYNPSRPTVARIRGMRASAGGLGISFVLIFPLIGLVLAMAGTRKGLRARRLMSNGELALGALQSKEPTNTRINEQMVYRYTFTFDAEGGGTYEVVGKTHRPAALEDEEFERIVYDPRNPSEATLLDELPCRPSIDGRGNFGTDDSELLWATLNLILPSVALLAYGAYLLA